MRAPRVEAAAGAAEEEGFPGGKVEGGEAGNFVLIINAQLETSVHGPARAGEGKLSHLESVGSFRDVARREL